MKLPNGAKAHQRGDREDRSIPFMIARRRFFDSLRLPPGVIWNSDIDLVVMNRDDVRLIIEHQLVEPKLFAPEKPYLRSVDAGRAGNDRIMTTLCQKLDAPGYLVLFDPTIEQEDDSPVWWRSISGGEWDKCRAIEFFKGIYTIACEERRAS